MKEEKAKFRCPLTNIKELLGKKVATQKEISLHMRLLEKEIPALQELIKEVENETK